MAVLQVYLGNMVCKKKQPWKHYLGISPGWFTAPFGGFPNQSSALCCCLLSIFSYCSYTKTCTTFWQLRQCLDRWEGPLVLTWSRADWRSCTPQPWQLSTRTLYWPSTDRQKTPLFPVAPWPLSLECLYLLQPFQAPVSAVATSPGKQTSNTANICNVRPRFRGIFTEFGNRKDE